MKRFDLVTFLLALAGKLQNRRAERIERRYAALRAASQAADEASLALIPEKVAQRTRAGVLNTVR